MANIDRADWHYGGNYPPDLPPENGGTHIGMYLAWVINRGLGSRTLAKHIAEHLPAFRERQVTGRYLLMTDLDEKFFPSLLSAEGKRFTNAYYESDTYVQDYADLLSSDLETVYHVADSWENYDRLAPLLDERFAKWRASESGQP